MKHVILPLIALALIIGIGAFESIAIHSIYKDFEEKVDNLIQLCLQEDLTQKQYETFCQDWVCTRKKSELFLPHNDVYEITLRVSEIKAYVIQQDYQLCLAHLLVIKDLASYVGQIVTPSLGHIL